MFENMIKYLTKLLHFNAFKSYTEDTSYVILIYYLYLIPPSKIIFKFNKTMKIYNLIIQQKVINEEIAIFKKYNEGYI